MFGSFAALPERPFTSADHAISERMLDLWASFVKRGDPGGGWPRADVTQPVFMELGDRFAPLAPLPIDRERFWEAQDAAAHQFVFD